MYAIGAFAKLTGVTPKALYLYERRGLIEPRRTRAGYRRYTMRELQQLSRVLALKTLGLSLQEITRLRPAGSQLADILARRRAALEEKREQLDRALRAIDAIADAEQPPDALEKFVNESSWDRWEARRQAFPAPVPRAPDRASPSRVALFRKIHDALERDPRGRAARALVREWDALLEREAGDDEGMANSKRQRWAGRQQWPAGMRQYVASLYDMEPAVWERVAAFVEREGLRKERPVL